MATSNQKASERPISFVLHDMAAGTSPVEVGLVIRPEDLTRSEASRLSVTQTLGGAWADSFGPGVPTLQISGHTGWGAGTRPNGLEEFSKLHEQVFRGWHEARDKAVSNGTDPDKVRLIFADALDDFTWVVAPQNFVLKRNKSRPLLAQYQIALTWLSDDVAETMDALAAANAAEISVLGKRNGLDSLIGSINRIRDAAKAGISRFLGPIQGAFETMTSVTANVLSLANAVLSGATSITGSAANGLLNIASNLSRAAANATNMVQQAVSLPQRVKAQFQRVASAFENAFCLLGNVFKPRKFLPNYEGLYGASMCSSTSGGSPISQFDTENPFPIYRPVERPVATVSPAANAAMAALGRIDPVLAPMSLDGIGANMLSIGRGIVLHG